LLHLEEKKEITAHYFGFVSLVILRSGNNFSSTCVEDLIKYILVHVKIWFGKNLI